MKKLLLILLLSALMTGCARHTAFVSSAVDPAYSPQRDEAVIVTLPNEPTVLERQLLPVLKGELSRSKFQVTDDLAKARWVITMSANRTNVIYSVTSTIVNMNPQLALASPPVRTVPTTTIYLSLIDASQISAGRAVAIWHGAATAFDPAFEVGNGGMIRRLLEFYGKNIRRDMYITRSKFQRLISSEEP